MTCLYCTYFGKNVRMHPLLNFKNAGHTLERKKHHSKEWKHNDGKTLSAVV